jgi:hypothetical protein
MIGDRIAQLAQEIVRSHTYEVIVAPAIADLQYESRHGRWASVRGYLAAWRAIAAAVVGEVTDDCTATLKGAPVSRVLGPAMATLALTSLIFAPRIWMIYGDSSAPWHHDIVLLALWLPGMLATVAPAVSTPAAAALARTGLPGSQRAALLLTAAFAMMVIAATNLLERELNYVRWDMLYTSSTSVRAGTQDRPLWELRQEFVAQREALMAREPAYRAREIVRQQAMRGTSPWDRHEAAAGLVLVVGYALLGIAWSRKTIWKTTALAVGVFFTIVAGRYVLERVLYIRSLYGFITAVWTPVALLLLTAALIALRAHRTGKGGLVL